MRNMRYLGVADMIALIEQLGIGNVLKGMAAYIEEDFRNWPDFDKTPRVASHSDAGVIELMPTANAELYGFKYVNGHPGNFRAGLQTVTGFGVLADVATGYPMLLSEMTIATALRTAAASAMAARHLARADSKVMALIGAGAQSEFQTIAFKEIVGINRVQVYDIAPEAIAKYRRNLAGSGIEITVAGSAAEAVQGADIITTVTADKRNATILSDNMVSAGVHVNAIGGDCPGKTELQASILTRGRVFVEYPPQTRIEGEIQQMPEDFPVTELWSVITGATPGRLSAHEITIFDSVGFAIEDFSALRYLWDQVQATGHGQIIDLLTTPEDPRDLFGLLSKPEAA
ncbi:ornithine cyclodeaminase (plasmid) [Paracoccus aminophilus JCM 7686]|uniref:Ornithine cyclodeaminase n=2 Tax=Paracoccus aminophilus TaxID=34003 RepID=S5Y621_PARAH|nr:ornithine cyclodeaminase [Paracoccus aminophilus JCM 7686]